MGVLLDCEYEFIWQVWFKGDQFPLTAASKSGSRKRKKVDSYEVSRI